MQVGIITDNTINKSNGATKGDGFIIMNNNTNLFLQSGNGNTAFCITPLNKIGFGTTQPNEQVDINGSIVSDVYKIQNISNPLIDISGNINTSGVININNSLNVNNNLIVDNSGNTTINGTLDISKNLTINTNKFTVDYTTGNVKSNGRCDISGNFNINNNFISSSNGSTIIKGTLDVSKNTVFYSDVSVNGIMDIGTNHTLYIDNSNNKVCINTNVIDPSYNLIVNGNTLIDGDLIVNGTTKISDSSNNNVNNLNLTNHGTGPALIINQLGEQPILQFKDDNIPVFHIANNGLIGIGNSNINPTHTLDVSGNVYIKNDLKVGEQTNISGPIVLNDKSYIYGNLQSSNNLNILNKINIDSSGNLDISGNLYVNGVINTYGAVAQTGLFSQQGDLDVSGSAYIKGNIDLSENLRVNINKFTVDPSGNIKSQGTCDISGGFAINTNKFIIDTSGNMTTYGSFDISNNFTLNTNKFTIDTNSNVKAQGNFDISNNLNINNKFTVYNTGNIQTSGTLDLSNNFKINNNKFIIDSSTGNISMAGNFDISNNFTINNNKFIVNQSSGNVSSQGRFDVSNNLTVNTDKFIAFNNGNLYAAGNLDISGNFTANNYNSTIDSSGNIKTKGNFTVDKNIVINNNAFVLNNGNIATQGNFDISKNISVGTNVFYVDTSGSKVGVNTSTPSYNLDVSGNITTNNAYLGIYNNNAMMTQVNNKNNTDYLMIQDSSGNTTINSKSTTESIDFSFSNNVKQKIYSNGNMYINGNLFTYSDIRIKDNIKQIDLPIEKLQKIRGVTYNLLNETDEDKKHVGVIAQEIENVVPEAVFQDGNIKTVAYGNLVGLLVEAIKVIDNKISVIKCK